MSVDLSGLPLIWQIAIAICTVIGWALVLFEIVLPISVLVLVLGLYVVGGFVDWLGRRRS